MKRILLRIGVLDIQGSVEEHFEALKRLGEIRGKYVEPMLVKTLENLNRVSGLIIPGGESTTIGKLLRRFGLRDEIVRRAAEGMPIWGTCAGAILLAKKIRGEQKADTLKLMNIEIERNAYGRQIESFETQVEFDCGIGGFGYKCPAIFIRAPKIVSIGRKVKILAKDHDEIVAVREGNLMATTFHPELTDNLQAHEYFAGVCAEFMQKITKE